MKAEYVNSFYKATQDVFRLMLDVETEKKGLKVVEDLVHSKDANVVLGVTGDLRGTILFNFPKDMTLKMVKTMSGMEMDEIDVFVSSALGEIANIIGGNAMTLLTCDGYTCDIVPPQVFVGEYKSYIEPKDKALFLTLGTEMGEFDINILLKEK